MNYRMLGRTRLRVSEVGLGTEYFNGQTRETVVTVIRRAIAGGVNYFDIVYSFAEYRENLGAAFRGQRNEVFLAGHLGCAETAGQYRRSRDVEECRALFLDLLKRLGTDHVDVVCLQYVDDEEDYGKLMAAGGLYQVARELRNAGQARFIGVSSHDVAISRKAVGSGAFDVLMFPVNLSWDERPGRRELFQSCEREGVGLAAMKPFAGGELLRGGDAPMPIRCLSYVLSQPGISTVVPGVRNESEVESVLAFVNAGESERDYAAILPRFQKDLEGHCVYCNHCLPCPAGIDIGRTLRITAVAEQGISSSVRAEYVDLPAPASACTECGACAERCPFRVDVVAMMLRTAELLG